MKILFISVHIEKAPFAFPLAGALLAAAVRHMNSPPCEYSAELADLYLNIPAEQAVGLILAKSPDIAAFSVAVWNRDYITGLAEKLKQLRPELLILAGGPEVTADPDFFAGCSGIDWFVRGEGEEALQEFLRTLAVHPDAVPEPEQTPRLITDPGSLPSPFTAGIIDLSHYDGMLWELSRGCPFACDFCFESKGDSRVRRFSLERIERELDLIIQSGICQVFVLDPTFNVSRNRTLRILEMIRIKAPEIHFTFEARSEFLDEETAALFGEITCSVQIGLQSADPEVLKKVNRTLVREDFSEKVLYLHQAGAVYGFDLIYGLPGDNLDGFRESLNFALSMMPNHIDIFPLAVLKGTVLYDNASLFGLQYRGYAPYTVISTPDFPENDIQAAEKLAAAFDFFYNRGRAVPWFHLILDALRTSAAEFLEDFLTWSDAAGTGNPAEIKDESRILRIQRDYTVNRFVLENRDREGQLARDIITYLNSDEPCTSLHDMDRVIEFLESGVSDLEEILFFL